MPMGRREDLFNITVTISGTDSTYSPNGSNKCKFTFDKMDGGDITSKDTKFRPGNGTEDEVSLGGSTSVGNITVTKVISEGEYSWIRWLINQVGKADMFVNKQPVDNNGAPWGKPLTYKGKLIAVNPPKTDSESDAAAMLSLIQSTVTPVNQG